MTNSLVVHASSPSLSQPFTYRDTVMDIYATNADALVDPTDGTVVVLAMGEPHLESMERPCAKGLCAPPPPLAAAFGPMWPSPVRAAGRCQPRPHRR